MKVPVDLCFLLLLTTGALFAQDPPKQDTDPQNKDDAVLVTGGVPYSPEKDLEEKLRDPFKSPFELEQEEQEKNKNAIGPVDLENRLPYTIGELELRGIYLQAQAGYVAIFRVGDDYKWWKAGTKFQDADLINITDGAVIFKQYSSDEEMQVREVIKELRRGEE